MTDTPASAKPPLDEVMLAMDVVDTLRHRELIVQREISADERDRRLIDRLRAIYAGQGIEVSDAVLERGVRDLRENRFVYSPPPPSVGHMLARVYVSRGRWAPLLTFAVAIVAAALFAYQTLVTGPQAAAIAALPEELEQSYSDVASVSELATVDTRAATLLDDGRMALTEQDYDAVRTVIAELEGLESALLLQYELHIVSRPGELSGVWRVPEDNPDAQNYYLIVEALDPGGNRLRLPIRNEENGRTYNVERWGQRVDEARFRATASDKQDDGIIQDDVIGEKRRGVIEPDLRVGVLSGAITDW